MQYSLLTPVRYLIDPRYHLTSPLFAGLFYLSPGLGFALGTIGGGWWADLNVRKYIIKRGGVRIPEDRLHSGLVAFFLLLPGGTLVYGWCLDYVVGGLALAAIAIFFSCLGLMMAMSSLNTYSAGKAFLRLYQVLSVLTSRIRGHTIKQKKHISKQVLCTVHILCCEYSEYHAPHQRYWSWVGDDYQ